MAPATLLWGAGGCNGSLWDRREVEAEGEKRNGSRGNEVNREERFGTVDHAVGRMLGDFQKVAVYAASWCLM